MLREPIVEDSPLGPELVRPRVDECEGIDRIIMDELVYGSFKPESIAYLQHVIARLKNENCDAVVLGCTEIPLIINDGNSPLPTLDSTRLLARAALQRALCSFKAGSKSSGFALERARLDR